MSRIGFGKNWCNPVRFWCEFPVFASRSATTKLITKGLQLEEAHTAEARSWAAFGRVINKLPTLTRRDCERAMVIEPERLGSFF
jgi:hypothetical protein